MAFDVSVMTLELDYLRDIIDKVPHTPDGVHVIVGNTVMCPNGHQHTYSSFDKINGSIYCTKGDCWSDGCQSDSGSGTHYRLDKLTRYKDEC